MAGSNCLRHTIFFGNEPAAAAISRSFIKHNSGFIILACRRICIINTVILYNYIYIYSTFILPCTLDSFLFIIHTHIGLLPTCVYENYVLAL